MRLLIRGVLLAIGALTYLHFVQIGNDAATSGLLNVQKLYTHAMAEAASYNR
jgi:hypothetical protein